MCDEGLALRVGEFSTKSSKLQNEVHWLMKLIAKTKQFLRSKVNNSHEHIFLNNIQDWFYRREVFFRNIQPMIVTFHQQASPRSRISQVVIKWFHQTLQSTIYFELWSLFWNRRVVRKKGLKDFSDEILFSNCLFLCYAPVLKWTKTFSNLCISFGTGIVSSLLKTTRKCFVILESSWNLTQT